MCQLETISILEQAAAKVMDCEPEELREERYDTYGLKVFSVYGLEYAVGTDEQAQEACKENIKQSLWAFNASFIIDHSKIAFSNDLEKSLKEMQSKLCEGANELVAALIEDLDEFIEDAISADGRGHFLSSYDGNEEEIKINNEYFYAYRLN
jgi:hypothetical protein